MIVRPSNLFYRRERLKIPCYVLVYRESDIIKKSLDTFTELSDDLDITVIQNPSENSNQITKLIDQKGYQGKIKQHYLFDENISNSAYDIVLTKELPEIKKYPFVLISDGDITLESPHKWLDETIRTLSTFKEVFGCGATMSDANLPIDAFPEADSWIPPLKASEPFLEGLTGCHLLMLRGKEFFKFMRWKEKNNRFFVDGDLHKYCYSILHKKWARTHEEAYHLTWDLYADRENSYTKLKTAKSFEDTWYKKEQSAFELTVY